MLDSSKKYMCTMEISLENLRESIKRIVEKGIANAKFHGINLHPGVENLASGDCAFECMIDGISTRQCFAETFDTCILETQMVHRG